MTIKKNYKSKTKYTSSKKICSTTKITNNKIKKIKPNQPILSKRNNRALLKIINKNNFILTHTKKKTIGDLVAAELEQ